MLQEQMVAGLTISRLEWLCQPGRVERTMHLLFALNHWAKARDRLFYVDRQGLYTLKAALLRQAYRVGTLSALAYIDGIEGFGEDLAFDMAADIATDALFWRLEDISDPARLDLYDQLALKLYLRLTGKQTFLAEDLEKLYPKTVYTYIRNTLKELEQEARLTRQPVPWRALMDLCIAPSDLLCIQDRRYYELGKWNSWDQLDATDLRKLDPEGLSLIAFHFTSLGAHYVFHLPYRLAQAFLPHERLRALHSMPTTSREHGEYYGRAITAEEALQQPVEEILRELGVATFAICPRQLCDKRQYVQAHLWQDSSWADEQSADEDQATLTGEVWWEEEKPASSSQVPRNLDCCPLCQQAVTCEADIRARFLHWQNVHSDIDLTFSQLSWVIAQTFEKKHFYQEHPADYRAPDDSQHGTRYWRLQTLGQFVNFSQ